MRRTRGRTLGIIAAAALAVSTLAGCGDDPAAGTTGQTVAVLDGWVRTTDGAQDTSMSAAFMEIDNLGSEPITLVEASSPVAGMTQLHEMVDKDGTMTMQQMTGGLRIDPKSHQHLSPGGTHVMLMDLSGPLAVGDEVDVTLTFDDGTSTTVTLPVKEFTEEEDHYHSDAPAMTMSPGA